jgi:outer membrane protein OmpA-like peptidoglycan-associated protein/uncharacterized protein YktA (UPF0223 family)
MPNNILSFASSSTFRDALIARNLAPYSVQGGYTPPSGNITYEASPLNNFSVVDSPNNLILTNQVANSYYPLNEYGPNGGYQIKYSIPGSPLPVTSNMGPYSPTQTALDLVNEFYIDAAYIQNVYGPQGGFQNMVVITDINNNNKVYLPYWDPSIFVPSFYSPYEILSSDNPTGSNGTLSQDSYIAKLGAIQLKKYFEDRIAYEITKSTIGSINLDTLSDPFSASLLASGQQPFFIKNWKITVPEFPPAAALSFANRLTGTYFPVSFIPGDYFEENDPQENVSPLLTTINNLTGGFLGPILNKKRNPSEIFVANTGNGQRSALFASLDYNLYSPNYNRGIIQGVTSAINNLFKGGGNKGGYYVGNENAEPSQITSPDNEVAVDRFGKQQSTIVYGPSELSQLYEGNESKLNFGLKGDSYTDGGGIDGKFIWTSPKYKDNAGFKVGPGSQNYQRDNEFNVIESQYNQNLSTEIDYKGGSILDNTQRIVQSGDKVSGEKRLKHVGNAINQVSKVFNDGYKEITKGSQVIAYYDSTTDGNTIGTSGFEVGREYCRVFQKDTPYFTYADLQKTDGITISGRKFSNSVLDNTYNLNIAPLRGIGSTNIMDGKVKKYMFSLENLAWRTSDQPGFTYDDLATCERGPNGGRIMWFPPYDITFSEDSKSNWNPTSFLGRPEPIYTYKNTTRSGSISWKIVVDTPAAMNTIIEKQLANRSSKEVNSIIDSFFAGCVKYDIYDLAVKFNTIPTNQLYTYQQLLNEPRLTDTELGIVMDEIPVNKTTITSTDGDGKSNKGNNVSNEQKVSDPETLVSNNELDVYKGYGFYFENDIPKGNPNTTASDSFDVYYTQYIALKNTTYVTKAPNKVFLKTSQTGGETFDKTAIPTFFNDVIEGNFNSIKGDFMKKLDEILIAKKGKVTLTLEGSASSPNTVDYNQLLSQRRIDSVKKWFSKQIFSDNTKGSDHLGKDLIINSLARGEKYIIPVSIKGQGSSVDCTIEPQENDINGKVTSETKWYSIPAMVCRRVAIIDIKAEVLPEPKVIVPDEQTNNEDETTIDTSIGQGTKVVQPVKPIAPPDPIKKVKDGISKKILRYLFSECDYFDVIKESNPMVYDSIKEKIKYFNPAFHSMTPEGLNSRLTFLNQCMRPGQTIPVIGADGKPKHNDALNTSFGAPPVLVLRIGDFYHTKIVPNSLGITYDPLLFDINPEGIGVQPMIAKVTLGFDFIGGQGLSGPIETLQNALSFNFYGNTEIYDDRSQTTESTKERDEQMVAKIIKGTGDSFSPLTTNQVKNQIPQKGGSTVGTIMSTTLSDDGNVETGEINYDNVFKELSDNTNKYFITIFNQVKTLHQISNIGIVQLVNFKRDYTIGDLSQYETPNTNIPIYGKPKDVEKRIADLIDDTKNDVSNSDNPIVKEIDDKPYNFKNSAIRELKSNLEKVIIGRESGLNLSIIGSINEMVTYQENYNYTLRKLDVICDSIDGVKLDGGKIKVYTLNYNGTETNTITNIRNNYASTVGDKLIAYSNLLDEQRIVDSSYDNKNNIYSYDSSFNSPQSDADKRFYMVMSEIFLDNTKFTTFVNSLITDKIKSEPGMEDAVRRSCNNFKDICKSQYDFEKKLYTDFEVSPEYQLYKNFKIESFDTKLSYSTDNIGNNLQKKNRLKDLFSDTNINNKEKTYNDKVKFN